MAIDHDLALLRRDLRKIALRYACAENLMLRRILEAQDRRGRLLLDCWADDGGREPSP